MATDRVIRGASEVVSVPLSADLMLPETSGVSCVSVPTLAGVGEDTGSRKIGPCPGGLKGVFTTVSSCWRKEERTKETGVDKEMGSGVGPEGVLATPASAPAFVLPVLSVPRLSGPVVLV